MNLKGKIKDELSYIKDTGKILYSSFPVMPWNRSKKLDKIRRIKDFYQDIIEKKTGKDLGDIEIVSLGEGYLNSYHKYSINLLEKRMDELSGSKFKQILFNLGLEFITYPSYFVSSIFDSIFLGGFYSDKERKIAVNLSMNFLSPQLDKVMVHELSHGLWHRINKSKIDVKKLPKKEKRNYQQWNEGFCTYLSEEYFSEHYPEGFCKSPFNGASYLIGNWKVGMIHMIEGEDALFDIPNRWREFEERFSRE